MNQSSVSIQIALLYSIKTDDESESQIDKIDFMNNNTQQFYSRIQNEILQVKGLFGIYQEVQREIQLQINEIVNLQSYLSHSEKGSLIAIKYENIMIFCLILSETFFVTKPINEKAIEIVLFRVLQDLTDNIKLCFNDEQLKKNWYQGDIIPFNQIQQRTEYYFAESENKQIQQYDCIWSLSSKNNRDYNIINSQTLSPQLTRIRKLQFSQQESKNFDQNFDKFIILLLLQILNTNSKQISQLIGILNIEYQSQTLKIMLNQVSDELEKEANSCINILIETLVNERKSIFTSSKIIDNQRKKFEEQVNNILKTLKLSDKRVLVYNQELIQKNDQQLFELQMDKFWKLLEEKISRIKTNFNCEKNAIIDELRTSYVVERISLRLQRVDENQSGSVKSISQIDNQQYTILNKNCFKLQSSEFNIKDIFETKEKARIYIITSQGNKKKCQTHIYFHMYKTTQIQSIKQLDIKDTEQAVFFHDYSRGCLYIFNFKKFQVLQMIITDKGLISSESQIYYQQELSSRFIVSHVAYLNTMNKFLVLSKDKLIYKSQDQGQDFEKVKCKIQIENLDPQEEEFKATIQPDIKYNQLIGCPSGRYFYLANNYCCDRYDLNCLKLDYIKIDGPIKIFADFQDVIILGQLNSTEVLAKNAKIISNLVSQKKFNKQENYEKNVIGNPALDIVKGSFIKFGPNSQFLLKEKLKHISLYVNKEYYDKIDPYLNILNVNEIILSSSKLQFAEYKNEQIKNIIFSRVPLQLCTIENSNLIPLNDGFRQQSQTQTIISVDQKVKQLHLGFLEDHLSNYNNKIFVVGIIGKQSSGKSYLLNRVFGTRFSVSSARCTDGVWGSIAYIEDQTFLVLDCEGLFNGARTDKEEIKILAFLTALCDITILNSDLTFNRHFNELFNHLVEASKQLNDEKLFKGILYYILRDVSSNDNSGAEKELLKNLERLKESGTEEIVFLKRLFNNKFAVEKLVNYEVKLFDQQLIAVRKYFLDNSAKSNRWKDGKQLIQIMKILLCQLELSDNTYASLIDLQLRIDKIFEESNELWYDFFLNEVSDNNLQLVQSDYKFPKHEKHQHLLFNIDLVKQLYKNLITEDTISTHNKNLLQIKTQFHLMMEKRKELIIQRAQSETININNEEVKVIIEKNMSLLKIFLTDQIKQYQFCEDKCNDCHLQCKSFKNHIEISQTLMQKLHIDIDYLEKKHKKQKIKNKTQEQEKRERIDQINEGIKQAEQNLEGLIISKKIIEIKEKLSKEKDAMKKYDFYDSNGEYIDTNVFQMTQFQNENLQTATLENMEKIQNLLVKEIPLLRKTKELNNKRIQQQEAQLEQLEKDLIIEMDQVREIETNQVKLSSSINQINEQKLKIFQDLQSVQNEISTIQNVGQDINIPNLQSIVYDENSKLIEIGQELQIQESIYKQNSEELESLLKMQEEEQIQYLDQLEQDINEYLEKQNQLDEEIETLKKKKRDIEEIRMKLEKEKSKKMGRNEKKIMELNQELKGLDEKLINDQLQYCELKQKEIEQNFKNFENSELYNKCIEEIQQEQKQDQMDNKCIEKIQKEQVQDSIDNKCIEQQEFQIQTNQLEMNLYNQQNQCQQNQYFETKNKNQEKKLNETKPQIIKLLLKKKKEIALQCKVKIDDLKEQIEQMKNKIDNINQKIQETLKMNKLLSTSESQKSDISQFDERLKSLNQKLLLEAGKLCKIKQNQETIKNNIDEFVQNNKELENKNAQIDELDNKLNLRQDQINIFKENLNEYIILQNTLQEEEIQLQKFNDFESVKNLSQSEVYSKIQQLENKIQILKEEKDSISKQLSTFNQIAQLEQDLKNKYDLKKKLVELKFEVHSCQRQSHNCDQNCKICPNQTCDKKAGHDEQEEHLCQKQDHKCQDVCQVINCQRKCMKRFKHDFQHKCEYNHPCIQKCQYCDKRCKKDLSNPHENNHDCSDKYCTHYCKLCSRKCCESHQHSKENDNHFCEDVHYCQEQCEIGGICKLEYEVIQPIWNTSIAEFKYTQYIPKDNGKQRCQKQLPVGSILHDGKHICKNETKNQFHICNEKCPECNTYCDLKYGHQGLHSSDRHRNKENQIFTIQEGYSALIKIQDQQETKLRKYQIGESSAPETCDQSCKRRGRSHFHLVKCQGGYNCLQNKNQYKARHSKEKYVKFEDLNFDEVLCIDFWKLKNWAHPIFNELGIINKCNYYCPLCIIQTNNYQFCDSNAWHTNDDKISAHSFSCIENHLQNQIQGINVTFVIDSTLSMGKYLEKCKLTIRDIMQKIKVQIYVYGKQLEVNFAAVTYKDHKTPYDQSQKIIDIQDFTSENVIISFLDKIVLEHGIDYPEAVLDGLDASLKLKWNPNYEKLLYLIADSPPHGKLYHNYLDNFPEGCPCGLKQESIFRTLQNIKVKFKILKVNQHIEMMIAEFKKDFKDLQVLTPDKQNEDTFFNLIVDDVCRLLANNEITYEMKNEY
ncbi:unnamed protein product [Paramecium primaurelia]|uniref:VLIG-type G domain-containing protein n=1 Tax=Paramecium primaurelia TaxID=5886 RepID=A0A8S1MZJ6_PARPR|nr:unnamed protein product [Paramecium primaurelia]